MDILDPDLSSRLRREVDALVATNATLEAGRQVVYRSLDLLEALARDAPRALGDDHEAAERMRLLLSLSAELAAPFHEGEELVSSVRGSPGNLASAAPITASVNVDSEPLDAPVLVQHGGVVFLGLAAARVGADLGLSGAFVDVVFGLAMAASTAERLARALSEGLDARQLAAALAALGHATGRDSTKSQLAAFLTSVPERRRWSCLVALRQKLLVDLRAAVWDATAREGIVSVTPRSACPGSSLLIQAQPAAQTPGIDAQPAFDEQAAAWYLPRLAGEEPSARVIFAAAGLTPLATLATRVDEKLGQVEVIVPESASPGWLGFFDLQLLSDTNLFRQTLRAAWAERNGSEACLRGARVPVDEIPLLGDPPLPPALAAARVRVGAPRIRRFEATPERLEPQAAALLRWSVDGADALTFQPPVGSGKAEGEAEVSLPENQWLLTLRVLARNACGVSEQTLLVRRRVVLRPIQFEQAGAGPPLLAAEPATLRASYTPADADVFAQAEIDDARFEGVCTNGRLELVLPAERVQPGLRGVLRLFSRAPDASGPILLRALDEPTRLEDEREFAPAVVIGRRRSVVLIRPALLGETVSRVPVELARAALAAAARKCQQTLEIHEPPWIEDAEIALDGGVDADFGPAADELLERLDALAARHPGLERALWLSVVPDPSDEAPAPVARLEAGEAAGALSVATLSGLESVLLAASTTEAITDRLRLTGVLHESGNIELSAPARLERREAGPGCRFSTGLALIGVDARGRERVRRPITVLRRGLPARFSVLLPITPEVVAAEVRHAGDESSALRPTSKPLLRVYRPDGELTLGPVTLEGDLLHLAHHHTGGARPELVVEIASAAGWSPITRVSGCADVVELPLARLQPGTTSGALRVVGTDGWNTDSEELDFDRTPPDARVVIRRAGENRLWADVEPPLSAVSWQVGDETLADSIIELSPTFKGTVVVTARLSSGSTIEDRLEVGALS